MEDYPIRPIYPIRRILPDDRGRRESTENQQDQAPKNCIVASKLLKVVIWKENSSYGCRATTTMIDHNEFFHFKIFETPGSRNTALRFKQSENVHLLMGYPSHCFPFLFHEWGPYLLEAIHATSMSLKDTTHSTFSLASLFQNELHASINVNCLFRVLVFCFISFPWLFSFSSSFRYSKLQKKVFIPVPDEMWAVSWKWWCYWGRLDTIHIVIKQLEFGFPVEVDDTETNARRSFAFFV
jgi:hypothetical protein